MEENKDNTITIEQKPKRKKKPSHEVQNRRKAKVVDLALSGMLPDEIAKITGLTRNQTRDIIEKFEPIFKRLPDVDAYRSKKADLLAAGQLAVLESALSGNKLAKAGFLPTLQGFDILNKAERLDRDQSTDNISHRIFGKVTIGDGDK